MVFAINRTEDFEADLDEAISYLVNVLKNPCAAESLIDGIEEKINIIERNPCLYGVSRKPILHKACCRECFIENYAIIYEISGATVNLIALFHQRQLYEMQFLRRVHE